MTQHRMGSAALLLVVPALSAAQSPMKVGGITFGEAATVAEIDRDQLKGQASRLAWSPDGTELYIQIMDGEFGKPGARISHHVVKAEEGSKREVQIEPEWASAYWTAKSGQASPDGADFKVDLRSEMRTEKTVSAPMGGDLAKGGVGGSTGSSAGDAVAAAYNQASVPVHTMRLAGETVGEFVNSVIVPGLTFGWGPKGSKVIAYSAQKSGRVTIMDAKGRKQELGGSKDAILPAWSPDGSRLAWLQKDGKKKYELKIAKIQ